MPVSNGRCGRWRDHRQVINGILFRERTGLPWRDLPERFGPWKTVYERHRKWSADGTWERLKVCLADDCQWAYYDRSRNRSSVWCDMQVCGNRQKVRAFRARQGGRARR